MNFLPSLFARIRFSAGVSAWKRTRRPLIREPRLLIPCVTAPVVWPPPKQAQRPLWRAREPPAEEAVAAWSFWWTSTSPRRTAPSSMAMPRVYMSPVTLPVLQTWTRSRAFSVPIASPRTMTSRGSISALTRGLGPTVQCHRQCEFFLRTRHTGRESSRPETSPLILMP